MNKNELTAKISWVRLIYIFITVGLILLIIDQVSRLRGSFHYINSSNKFYDLIVLGCIAVTYLLAAFTYYVIAFKPLIYGRNVVVGFGINVLNKLLPAGIGGIGGNYLYLTHNKHTKSESAAVVAANAMLGITANLSLLVFLTLKFPLSNFKFKSVSHSLIITGISISLIVLVVVLVVPKIRYRLLSATKSVLRDLGHYRERKSVLLYGLLCQIGLALFFVSALNFSLKAVGVNLAFGSVMLAFSFSIWVGAIIPSPGGVGSVEAGLVAGLLAFKVDIAEALAAVLVFWVISFWVPFILGIPALIWSFKKGYL